MECTYCPEDNKLRLYVGRVSREWYERLRKAGYKSTPKQSCDFVATWSIRAVDLALELTECEDIGDEDISPEERAADRAERFLGYREKRLGEAVGHADNFDNGPAVHGYQNQQRAERAAAKHDRQRTRATSQWDKAEYWQRRTAGVISHALYKAQPGVRRGRILRLESELRKCVACEEADRKYHELWERIFAMDGAEEVLPLDDNGNADTSRMNKAQKYAYSLANDGRIDFHLPHPTCQDANRKSEELHSTNYLRYFTPYDFLTRTDYLGCKFDRLSPKQVADMYLSKTKSMDDPTRSATRYIRHLEFRLGYERQMQDAEGGNAAENEIEVGGWFGKYQVLTIHKSPATKLVTSVKVIYRGDGDMPKGVQRMNIQRLGRDTYKPPTDEDIAQAQTTLKEINDKKKGKGAPKLINPTLEHAERLQAIWNENAKHPSEVWHMTQKEYSARSKGSYSCCETATVSEFGTEYRKNWRGDSRGVPVFKIRHGSSGYKFGAASRVVVITDKPQKELPWDTMADIYESHPTIEELAPKAEWLRQELCKNWWDSVSPEAQELFEEFYYHGLAFRSSTSQFGLNEAGLALLENKASA